MRGKAANLELILHLPKRNFKIKKIVEGFQNGEFVAGWRPQHKNIAISINNGEWIRQGKIAIKTADVISMQLLTGSWTGKVYQIFRTNLYKDIPFATEGEIFMRIEDVSWEGNLAQLEYGVTVFGEWIVNDGHIKGMVDGYKGGTVETPEYPDPIPLDMYFHAKRLCDNIHSYDFADSEEKNETLRRIISFLIDLKAEIEAKKILEKL
ncbi:hypothetical protein [Thermicanus aegyptius]|uniref:hypothetical protein n=1 Tax=Thermicanus aegyptius TaxID=94009 RepID=UPI00049092C5|nr:hypothetical protein [Thermicanus aegyptius]